MERLSVSDQEERSVVGLRGALDIGERLSSKRATWDVEGQRQGHVVLGVYEQVQIGAENPSDCRLQL